MKFKSIFVYLVVISSFSSIVFSVETRNIDSLRRKDVLSEEDKQIVRTFVQDAVNEIFFAEDFSSISATRQALVSRKKSLNDNSQIQYQQFFENSAFEVLSESFDRLNNGNDSENAENVAINLLLIIKELESLKLVPLAVSQLDSQYSAVRYLAASSATNDEIISKLNDSSSQSIEITNDILQGFSGLVEQDAAAEVLMAVIDFCGQISNSDAIDLLVKISEKRMTQYNGWTVQNEFVDYRLLSVMGKKAMQIQDENKRKNLMASFAQLYSFSIQRYVSGEETLNETQKSQLVDVIVGVEQGVISEIIGSRVQNFKRAMERNDMEELVNSHDLLLGSGNSKGTLAQAIDFNYGVEGENVQVGPRKLAERPNL